MTPWKKSLRKPSPELLAAYADGELDGDAALFPSKKQVEEWLAAHPEDLPSADSQLKDLWDATAPAEPDCQQFASILERLQSLPADAAPRPVGAGFGWGQLAAGLAAAAAVWLALALLPPPGPDRVIDDGKKAIATPAAFPVASSGEIEILSVDGAATGSLVVGQVPVQGSLELLAPGDVTLTSVQPAAGDNMMPRVHLKGHETPMIWARVDSEP